MATLEIKEGLTLGRDMVRHIEDEQKLEELTMLYLRGEIEIEKYQEEIDQLQTQLDFRKLADRKMRKFFGLR